MDPDSTLAIETSDSIFKPLRLSHAATPSMAGNIATDRIPVASSCAKRPNSATSSPFIRPLSPLSSLASPSSLKRVRCDNAPLSVLPQRYEACPVEAMIALIAHMLAEIIKTNDNLPLAASTSLTRFHSRSAPAISVTEYLRRLARHASLTPPLMLSMVYYIDRLCVMYPDFTINTLTVHRFLITAATVAAKGLSDAFWNNSTYARIGGIRVTELKLLELEFLYRVDWRIVPNPDVLEAYYIGLVERHPAYELPATSPATSAQDIDVRDRSLTRPDISLPVPRTAAPCSPSVDAQAPLQEEAVPHSSP